MKPSSRGMSSLSCASRPSGFHPYHLWSPHPELHSLAFLAVLQPDTSKHTLQTIQLLTSAVPSEHNAKARVTNSHIAQSANPNHITLTVLHDIGTNRPIRQLPKHERDITTLGQSQVIQILQALDIKTLGMGAADKKGELRAQLGLPKETSVTGGKSGT